MQIDNDLSARNNRIFDIIVKSYIETAEPVGSRALSRRYNLSLSPASIRNVMADLEEQGLLAQPHTSAGRVPTDKGYRYWVDRLMEAQELTVSEKDGIRQELGRARTLDGLAERASKVISDFTDNAAMVYFRNLKRVSFLTYLLEDLVGSDKLNDFFEEEPELFIEGASRVFEQPEFQDIGRMRQLLQAFDAKYEFLQIMARDLDEEEVHVYIGSESDLGELENVSLVVKDCYLGSAPVASIAVVGPTRMRYPKAISIVGYVASAVTDVVKRF